MFSKDNGRVPSDEEYQSPYDDYYDDINDNYEEESSLDGEDFLTNEGFQNNSGKGKKILIIILVLLMVASGGYFVYGKFIKSKQNSNKEVQDTKVKAEVSVSDSTSEDEGDENITEQEQDDESIPGLYVVDESPKNESDNDSYFKVKEKKSNSLAVKKPGSSEPQSEDITQVQDNSKEKEDSQYSNAIKPGAPDLMESHNNNMDTRPTSPKEFVSDINGNLVPSNYQEKNIQYEKDYANYKKKRCILDKGMEMLYLDITWKGLSYRSVVPMTIFKELDPEGIVPVDLEVTTTSEGAKLITYMRVRTKEIDKAKRE